MIWIIPTPNSGPPSWRRSNEHSRLGETARRAHRAQARDSGRKAVKRVGYLTGAIRLRDKLAALWQKLQLARTESRRHDDPDRRPSPAHCLRKFDPIHRSRHVNVGEHNSDIVPAFQDPDGFFRVRRPERLKSRVANHVDRKHQDKRLVLNREHHRSTERFQRNAFRVPRPKGQTFSGNWQRHLTSARAFRSIPDHSSNNFARDERGDLPAIGLEVERYAPWMVRLASRMRRSARPGSVAGAVNKTSDISTFESDGPPRARRPALLSA